jgi:hypothetical protein
MDSLRQTRRKIIAGFGAATLGRTRPLVALNINDLRRLVEEHERRAENMTNVMSYLCNPAASPFAHLAEIDFAESMKSQGAAPNAFNQEHQLEKATARAIIRAGETARAGGPAMPEPSGTARLILMAGKKRRGEI